MGTVIRIIALLFLSVMLVSGQECTTGLKAGEIVRKCYEATYDLIRRGYADDIASMHLQTAVADIIRHISTSNPNLDFGSACIPTEFFGQVFTVKWTTTLTEATLDDMLLSISNSFYDATKVDKRLPQLTTKQALEKEAHWAAIAEELKKPFVELNKSRFTFPSTAHHAHDEKYDAVCTEWYKQEADGISSTPAAQGLRKILKMVVQLILVGCDPNGSWQIIRHYTALTFLGIRCRREEGDALLIPDTYMEEYTTAGLQLMEDARRAKTLEKAVPFSDVAFDAIYKTLWQRFSTFGSWGTADLLFSSDVVIKNLKSFISNSVKEEFTELKNILITSGVISTSTRAFGHRGPDCGSPENFNGNMKCETLGNYCHYKLSKATKSWYENCCNVLICSNAVAILPSMDTFDDCCKRCNQFKCQKALLKNNDLKIPHTYDISVSIIHIYLW